MLVRPFLPAATAEVQVRDAAVERVDQPCLGWVGDVPKKASSDRAC